MEKILANGKAFFYTYYGPFSKKWYKEHFSRKQFLFSHKNDSWEYNENVRDSQKGK